MDNRPTGRHNGFSLVELLVVIGLIAILSAGLGLAFGGRNAGVALRSGETAAAGIFQAARSQAVLMQTRARVIVLVDPGDPERHLRHLGIVYEAPGHPDHWQAASDGARLPEGIRFRAEASIADGEFRLRYPLRRAQAAGSGPRWNYYEFDARGHLAAGSLRTFAIGGINPETGTVDATAPAGGFAILPLGGLAFPEDSEVWR